MEQPELHKIAKDICHTDKVLSVFFSLGFLANQILPCHENVKSGKGEGEILKLLVDWAERTPRVQQRSTLKNALVQANLMSVAEKYFGNGCSPRAGQKRRMDSNRNGSNEGEPIAAHYHPSDERIGTGKGRTSLGLGLGLEEEIQPLPDFEKVLRIAREKYTDPKRHNVDITEYSPSLRQVSLDDNGYKYSWLKKSHHDIIDQRSKRIMVKADGKGQGTALAHRMAYDWAKEDKSSPLKETPYLFEVDLGKVKKNQNLEDAIKDQLLSDTEEISSKHIADLIKANPKVVILLDGLDRFKKGGYTGNILRILRGLEMMEVTVMVTSSHQAASRLVPACVYKHIEML